MHEIPAHFTGNVPGEGFRLADLTSTMRCMVGIQPFDLVAFLSAYIMASA